MDQEREQTDFAESAGSAAGEEKTENLTPAKAAQPEGEGGAENLPEKADGAEGRAPEMQEAQPPKKKHRWIWNIVLIAVIALGIYSLFGISGEITEGDGYTFADAIASISGAGVAMLVAVVCGVMIVDCLKFCVVNKAVIGSVRPVVAIKTSFLGKFYDGITPFSTGGQPILRR